MSKPAATPQSADGPGESRRRALRDAFLAERGFWAPPFEAILAADSDFFAAYLEFSAMPARHGALEPKVRELIYIAVDAATTHLHAEGHPGARPGRLRCGASREEIMEALELASVLGIHTGTLAVPISLEVVEEATGPDAGPTAHRGTSPELPCRSAASLPRSVDTC